VVLACVCGWLPTFFDQSKFARQDRHIAHLSTRHSFFPQELNGVAVFFEHLEALMEKSSFPGTEKQWDATSHF